MFLTFLLAVIAALLLAGALYAFVVGALFSVGWLIVSGFVLLIAGAVLAFVVFK